MSETQKKLDDGSISDPDNYIEMRKGYPTLEEADAAMHNFWNEFYELRNKYRIADAHVIIAITIAGKGDMMLAMHAGNELMQEPMAAWALGNASANRQENIARLLAQSKSVKKPVNRK